MVSSDFRRQIQGFGLTTANILYRMPDHPAVLQSYLWQNHDLHPHFPELTSFWISGGANSKARCTRSSSAIAGSSSQPSFARSMASFG